jgi:ABC-type transport system involved in cytochrome c biogenesis ATPase subunit
MFEQHLAQGGIVVMTSHHDIAMQGTEIQRLNLSQ